MLSGKLIHLIELHSKDIGERIIREVRCHPEMPHLRQLPEAELRERGRTILDNLGHWLGSGNVETLAKEQEAIGRLRLEQAIPLHETVGALCLMKENMIDFLGEQGIPRDSLALYVEEELERRISRFFDTLIIHTIRGYETAWRRSAHLAA